MAAKPFILFTLMDERFPSPFIHGVILYFPIGDSSMSSQRLTNSSSRTIALPDGYNGHSLRFYVKPLEVDGHMLKLQCAEPGKEYLIRWVHAWDAAFQSTHYATVLP